MINDFFFNWASSKDLHKLKHCCKILNIDNIYEFYTHVMPFKDSNQIFHIPSSIKQNGQFKAELIKENVVNIFTDISQLSLRFQYTNTYFFFLILLILDSLIKKIHTGPGGHLSTKALRLTIQMVSFVHFKLHFRV